MGLKHIYYEKLNKSNTLVGMNMKEKSTKLFIDCEEAKHICDKAQYNETTWWELFRLNIRLLYCNITRAYSKRNQNLSRSKNRNRKNIICRYFKENNCT